ncbi:hypothetical protein ABTX15_09230 [Micromonospora sp. NPDC094482]|uniref:hypothetical protein n=1 Tax=unclassified Micromonospora TaxID=2617518 RepID=UPI00332D913D
MNEAERLRQAMRTTERGDRDSLDLAEIMRAGRRLRLRRRLASTGAAALSVAVLVFGVAVVGQLAGAPQPSPQPGPVGTAPATREALPSPSTTASPWEPRPKPLGAVVRTDLRYGDEERVFYFVPVDVPAAPRVTMGLVAGRRSAGGELTSDYLVNDVEGFDRRPGFHQIGNDQQGFPPHRSPVPTFGYFVGPAKRIVGTADGRQITARLARWSEDPQVVIFWFHPDSLAPGVELDGIVARDAADRRL